MLHFYRFSSFFPGHHDPRRVGTAVLLPSAPFLARTRPACLALTFDLLQTPAAAAVMAEAAACPPRVTSRAAIPMATPPPEILAKREKRLGFVRVREVIDTIHQMVSRIGHEAFECRNQAATSPRPP